MYIKNIEQIPNKYHIEQIPELSKLVHTNPDYIANINSYGNHSNCIITANDDLTGKINIGDELKIVSNNDVDKEFIIDATPYINRYKRRYAKITEIISSNQFKVDCEINNFCCIEDPFLIYGKDENVSIKDMYPK
jgi:outer membrane receptor for ferrienterochelin and colicin